MPYTIMPGEDRLGIDDNMTSFTVQNPTVSSEDILGANATSYPDEQYSQVSRYINLVALPIMMSIGFLCNGVSIATTSRKRFLKRSTYTYMTILGVADMFVLALLGSARIVRVATNNRQLLIPPLYCNLMSFLYFQSTHFASWLLVAITADRYIFTHYPLQRVRLCTPRRARHVSGAIAVLSVLANCHILGLLILVDTGEKKFCAARQGYETFVYEVWPYLDAVLYAYLPSLCITFMNILTVRELWRTRVLPDIPYGQIISKARRTTVMLINLTSLFVITTVTGNSLMVFMESMEETMLSPLVSVCGLIMYTNHACNLFLYYAFLKEIRVEIKRMVRRTQTVMPLIPHYQLAVVAHEAHQH